MIKVVMLKTTILQLLKTIYPDENYKYYGIEVSEGYLKPSFFVDVRMSGQTDETINIVKKDFSVTITYFQKKINEMDNLKKVDEIKDVLCAIDQKNRKRKMVLKVGDRFLPVNNYFYSYTGENNNILQIFFDISFYDFDEIIDREQQANEIEINTRMEE